VGNRGAFLFVSNDRREVLADLQPSDILHSSLEIHMFKSFAEIDRRLRKAQEACERLYSAQSADALRDDWESFLGHFASALGGLITLAGKHVRARPWGHKLKNAANENDAGLIFLREARNFKEHGLQPVAEFYDPSVNIGGVFELGGNCQSLVFSGNYINGQPMGDFQLSVQDGKVANITGAPKLPKH